jgi:hypothetical protein
MVHGRKTDDFSRRKRSVTGIDDSKRHGENTIVILSQVIRSLMLVHARNGPYYDCLRMYTDSVIVHLGDQSNSPRIDIDFGKEQA